MLLSPLRLSSKKNTATHRIPKTTRLGCPPPPVGKHVVARFARVADLRGLCFGKRILQPGNAPL